MNCQSKENVDYLISIHSDIFKETNGFRPRLDIDWDVVSKDPEGFVSFLEKEISNLQAEQKSRLKRKEKEKIAFVLKVSNLGLNPEKYLWLL